MENIVACSIGETTGQELRTNNLSFPHRFAESAAEHLRASHHFAVALLCVSAQESKLIVLWLKWRICTTFYPLPGVQCHASQLLPAQCMCPRLVRICGLPKGLQVQIGHVLFR